MISHKNGWIHIYETWHRGRLQSEIAMAAFNLKICTVLVLQEEQGRITTANKTMSPSQNHYKVQAKGSALKKQI